MVTTTSFQKVQLTEWFITVPQVSKTLLLLFARVSLFQVTPKVLPLMGEGGYSTPNLNTAQAYAGNEGIVFELGIKKEARIIAWNDTTKSHPFIKDAMVKAEQEGINIFDYLARVHGIDIIDHGHVLIQNSNAVEFPQGLKGLVDATALKVVNEDLDIGIRINNFVEYQKIVRYVVDAGEMKIEDIKLDDDYLVKLAKSMAKDPGSVGWKSRQRLYQVLGKEKDIETLRMLLRGFGDNDSDVVRTVRQVVNDRLGNMTPGRLRQTIESIVNKPDDWSDSVKSYFVNNIPSLDPEFIEDPRYKRFLKDMTESGSWKIRQSAAANAARQSDMDSFGD